MSPETGRFISMDTYAGTLDNPVSLHKYLYANANPVMYSDPTGNFSLSEISVSSTIQGVLDSKVVKLLNIKKMMSWANLAVTAYDISVQVRLLLSGEANILGLAFSIIRGLAVQAFLTCALSPAIGAAVNTILKVVGVAQDAYGLAEAIKSKDPVEIIVASLRLTVSIFALKCQCFTGDTLVSTEDGYRRIDEIKVGDKVWAYNTETGETELKAVLATPVTKTDILVHLTLSDGEEIQTTMFHPFYVQDEESQSNGRWVAASNLVSGDELLMEDGQRVYVERVQVEKLEEEINVYNLEVDEWHTYFVAGGVLVHNQYGENASEGGSDTTDLYRVMSQEEFDSVMENQKFVYYDRAMEDKWFATTSENATKWGNIFYPNGKYKKVKVVVKTSSLKDMYFHSNLDNIGPAYCASLEVLKDAIVVIVG